MSEIQVPISDIKTVNIEEELKSSYLDYAMSVIVSRALPDVRDGMKPVHRRVLYAMYKLGNQHNKPYKKSARIVGDVIGKYHPHGDSAVYNTMVRLAQDFSMRYPLVDGQGNFGSVDGDPPAAMRYTEVRMSKITEEILSDIDKETVEFGPNYDGNEEEPRVLPTKLPNLLVNGASGIAVGMSTSIPPHNIKEIIHGMTAVIKKPDIEISQLLKIIQGPDFPTAGYIYGTEGIQKAYETGHGIIQVRAHAVIEPHDKGDREVIVITQLPYQVIKKNLLELIAEHVRDKKLEGISEIRDESDREGMRIVIELKRGVVSGVVLNKLYKLTPLQSSFSIILLALDRGQPRIFNIKEMLSAFIDHRREIVIRRCQYDLRKASDRAHILEGLKVAVENIDTVVELIKKSKSPQEAKDGLIKKFKLSDIQAQSILDMRLHRLTGLEREKILTEHKETLKEIERLKKILSDDSLIDEIIVNELEVMKKTYGDERRTKIIHSTTEISMEDMIADEEMIVTVTHAGYIKRLPSQTYRSQRRGGRGVKAMETRDEDFISHVFVATNHSYILVFTSHGKVFWLKVHNIPEAGRTAKGKAIVNMLQLSSDEKVMAMLPVKKFEESNSVVMATSAGVVKRTNLMEFSRPRASGIIALTIDEGDALIGARLVKSDEDEIFLATSEGQTIRFDAKQARAMGRSARGVRGINLSKGDKVVGLEILRKEASIITVSAKGYGKRTLEDEYRLQNRGGKGIIGMKITEKNGPVIAVRQVCEKDELMIITNFGTMIRMPTDGISKIGRNTQGVRLISLKGDERVVGIELIVTEEDEESKAEKAVA
ncbi:MAG: DNA gyrase subunit A [Deltaproteobacteria bacterium]|nr:DNA gyrase subunit A [Deltaproteobacteria bacterium]